MTASPVCMRTLSLTALLSASAALLLGACAAAPMADAALPTSSALPALPAQWSSPPSPAQAHTAAGLGIAELDALVQAAHAQSPDLAAAVARLRQADAVARAAGAGLLPGVNATLQASRQARAGGQAEAAGNHYGATLAASYELDLWGRLGAEHASALALREASAHDRDAVQIGLTAAVAQGWLQLVGGRERLAIAELNLHSAERILAVVESRGRAGAATALEQAQQRGLVAAQRQGLEAQRQQVQVAHTALAVLLGQAEPPPVQARALPMVQVALPDAGTPTELLARRPDIAQAEQRLQAANADVAAARAALLPRISLSAGLATGGSGLARVLDNPVYSLAAALAAPLFDGGRLAAGRDLAQALQAELLAQYRAAIVAAVGDVELALQSLAGAHAQRAAQAQVVEQAARLAQSRYRAGAETLLTLLDAQRTLYAAQDMAAQLHQAEWLAQVALLRALGGGPGAAPMNDGDGLPILQRLRAAGLRPTIARIGVLQVIQAAGAAGIGADETFRQMLLRGTHVSTSTVYRIIHELQALGVLLHDRGDRHSLYRLCPAVPPPSSEVRVACRRCDRSELLPGARLRSELELRAAERDLRPLAADLVLQVDCLGCDDASQRAPAP